MTKIISNVVAALMLVAVFFTPAAGVSPAAGSEGRYACKNDLIEVIFSDQLQVRLRDGRPASCCPQG